ncbi:hypothetical protein Agub_g8597, partial [Astrephomene gubernaculifera]
MAPKGKASSGTDSSGGGEKDLSFFQEAFSKYRADPDGFSKKGGQLAELERLSKDDGASAQEKLLARLCRARILYEAACKDKKIKERMVDFAQLEGIFEQPPRSLTAACLLTAWYWKTTEAGHQWSAIQDFIGSVVRKAKGLDLSNEDEWMDPAEEAVVRGSKEKFEDFKEGATKLDRLKALKKQIEKFHRKAKEKAEQSRSDTALNKQTLQAFLAQQASQQQPQPDKEKDKEEADKDKEQRQQQQQPGEEETLREREALEEVLRQEKVQEEVERERRRCFELLGDKLRAAGPEGSEGRVAGLCRLFELEWSEFAASLQSFLERVLGELGYPASCRALYSQVLSAQLSRFRTTGRWLRHLQPDLRAVVCWQHNSDPAALLGLPAGGADRA